MYGTIYGKGSTYRPVVWHLVNNYERASCRVTIPGPNGWTRTAEEPTDGRVCEQCRAIARRIPWASAANVEQDSTASTVSGPPERDYPVRGNGRRRRAMSSVYFSIHQRGDDVALEVTASEDRDAPSDRIAVSIGETMLDIYTTDERGGRELADSLIQAGKALRSIYRAREVAEYDRIRTEEEWEQAARWAASVNHPPADVGNDVNGDPVEAA